MSRDVLVAQIAMLASQQHKILACAESCTGGGLAYALTAVPGSSTWFDRGFVTYSNQAKQQLLGVPANTLAECGAVSEPTAHAMAEGTLVHSPAHLTVSITGIAGPGGATAGKPVGTVCFGLAHKGHATQTTTQLFSGDRHEVREKAINFALTLLKSALS